MPKNAWLAAALVWTVAVVVLCLVSFNELPSIGGRQADKFAHFVFHFVFCALWIGYAHIAFPRAKVLPMAVIVFVSASVFGIALEFAQEYFTQTRSADILDVAANATGALSGVWFGSQLIRGIQGRQKT